MRGVHPGKGGLPDDGGVAARQALTLLVGVERRGADGAAQSDDSVAPVARLGQLPVRSLCAGEGARQTAARAWEMNSKGNQQRMAPVGMSPAAFKSGFVKALYCIIVAVLAPTRVT